jgi:hypothetical protein
MLLDILFLLHLIIIGVVQLLNDRILLYGLAFPGNYAIPHSSKRLIPGYYL